MLLHRLTINARRNQPFGLIFLASTQAYGRRGSVKLIYASSCFYLLLIIFRLAPTFETASEDAKQEWISLNSFSARLLNVGLLGSTNIPMWVLRDALEEDISFDPARATIVAAAAEWILHARNTLYTRISKEPANPDTLQATAQGPLYEGKAGFPLERWIFWKRRFREISDDLKEPVKQAAIKAAEII